MALDKMVDSTKLDNALTATADAIREKGGAAASELIPFDLENETGFADAIGSISSGIEVDDIIIIGDYGLCLNNFTISSNTCISEVGTVSGNTLIAV